MDEPAQCPALAEGPDRRERRRRAMIDAARALFLERGYGAVSLGEIVRRSGGSLSTLYALFDNKAGLLGAVVEADRFKGLAHMATIIAEGGPPADVLRAVARELHDHFTNVEAIGLVRLVMVEALRDPAFARLVYQFAHEPPLQQLAGLFERWNASGEAQVPDPRIAAHFFLGMVVHGAQTRALFKDPCELPRPPVDVVLDEAVRLFLAGYAPAG